LLITAILRKTTNYHIHWRLWEVRLHVCQHGSTWFEMDFIRCLTYVTKRPGASFSPSTSGAILGPPRCGTSNLAMGSVASSRYFSWPQSFAQCSLSFCRDL
jgi:hypothetical protein